MPEDLRRAVAKSQLHRKPPRYKWAPGACMWQAAAEYRKLPKPEKHYPVIVGGDGNLLQKPDDLRDLCHLPSVPPVSETTKAALRPAGDQESDKLHVFQVADVTNAQWADLMRRTRGTMEVVWFQGGRRLAWLAKSVKAEGEGDSTDDSDG